ncbi:hypothetical protein [Carboxylicivirga sp. N1Y90]|uniref:hypothetical protein n=1 Tax=Carboxylicivirga fragile TaxID=3417571 RepID=UPI003D3310B6|nr:hypothetical protein [Marinilabiliaceae bacterium N1Y90]
MKFYLTLVIVILATNLSFAQKAKHTVYLKNGTIIRGEITEINPDKDLAIKYGDQIFTFSNSDIERIDMGSKPESKDIVENRQLTGIYNKTTFGILAGSSGSEQKAPFAFTSSLGYHFSPNLSMGIGSGLEFYEETVLPAFVEAQYNFKSRKINPFVFAHGGWAFAIDDRKSNSMQTYDSKGGMRYGGGLGCIMWFNANNGIVFQVGYQFQEIEVEKTESYVQNNSTLIDEYNRFAVKIGFYFN